MQNVHAKDEILPENAEGIERLANQRYLDR